MPKKKQIFHERNLKAHKLYAETPLFKAILLVALPGLLISLMSGVYIFADQLLLALLIPNDGVHDFIHVFGNLLPNDPDPYTTISNAINTFNNTYNTGFTIFNPADIVKSAVSISSPITGVINAVPNIIGVGAGVMYTQAIARGMRIKGNQI